MKKITLFFLFIAAQNMYLSGMESSTTTVSQEYPYISLSLRGLLKGHSGWVTQLPTFKEDEQLSSEKLFEQFLNEIRLPEKDIQFYLSITAENRGRSINRAHFKKNRDSRSASPIIERNRSQSPPRSGKKNSGH